MNANDIDFVFSEIPNVIGCYYVSPIKGKQEVVKWLRETGQHYKHDLYYVTNKDLTYMLVKFVGVTYAEAKSNCDIGEIV